jgi:hypothetical protein
MIRRGAREDDDATPNISISNEGPIGVITMGRPPVNAMTTDMYGELNVPTGAGDAARDEHRRRSLGGGERAIAVDNRLNGRLPDPLQRSHFR